MNTAQTLTLTGPTATIFTVANAADITDLGTLGVERTPSWYVKRQAALKWANAKIRDYDEVYKGCVEARDSLIQTANKYRKKLNQPPLELAETHTWDEVDQSVQLACLEITAQDKKQATRATDRVRKAFRSLCRHAGVGQTVVSLLPGDALGLSNVICGGFKVIFSAMQQAAVYRETIFKALEELPVILEDASEISKTTVFKDSEKLHQRRAQLFIAIFGALRHILLWFVKNSLGMNTPDSRFHSNS